MVPCRVVTWVVLVTTLVFANQVVAAPERGPARIVPADGLIAYVEYDGLNAHTDAWKKTAAYAVLNRTEAGALVLDLASQVLNWRLKTDAGNKSAGKEVLALCKHIVRRGFVAGLDRTHVAVLVLSGVGRPAHRDQAEQLLKRMAKVSGQNVLKPIQIRRRTIVEVERPESWPAEFRKDRTEMLRTMPDLVQDYEPKRWLAWWLEGDDAVVILGAGREHVEKVLDTIDGKAPSAATHPLRITLTDVRGALDFEPVGLFFVLPSARLVKAGSVGSSATIPKVAPAVPSGVPPEPPPADLPPNRPVLVEPPPPVQVAELTTEDGILGFDRIKRITGHWGFQGTALASDIRVEVPQPHVGLAVLLKQPTFRKDQLPPIPVGVAGFTVVSMKSDQIYQAGVWMASALSPYSAEWVEKLEHAIDAAAGVRLRQDVLEKLGPSWVCFEDPETSLEEENRGVSCLVLLASVGNASEFAKTLDNLANGVNRAFREAEEKADGIEPAQPDIEFKPLPAPARGYVLTVPPGQVSIFNSKFRPTVMVGTSFVAFAFSPEQAHRALAAEVRREARWAPTGALVEMFQRLPDTLTFLNVGNPRNSVFPGLIRNLPELVQIVGTMQEIGELPNPNPGSELCALLNLPRPGGFRMRFDETKRPRTADVEGRMFPSVLAATVDARGLRVIARQSLPLDNLGTGNIIHYSLSKNIGQDAKLGASVKFK